MRDLCHGYSLINRSIVRPRKSRARRQFTL